MSKLKDTTPLMIHYVPICGDLLDTLPILGVSMPNAANDLKTQVVQPGYKELPRKKKSYRKLLKFQNLFNSNIFFIFLDNYHTNVF
jgi:hypothetical protein